MRVKPAQIIIKSGVNPAAMSANRGIESPSLIRRRRHRAQRYIQSDAEAATLAGFTARARTRISRIPVHRKMEERRVVVEDSLRAVAVRDVAVDDRDALDSL